MLPDGWGKLEFEKIACLRKTKFDPKSDKTYPCIELEHIQKDTGLIIGHIESKGQESTKNKFLPGDVLFGKLRPYLRKYAKVDYVGVCSSEIWVFQPSDAVTQSFLFHLIQQNDFIQATCVTTGSKMPRADWNYISAVPFLVPTKKEQEGIAEILSTCDIAIEKTEKLIEAKEKRFSWLIKSLIDNHCKHWEHLQVAKMFTSISEKNNGNEELLSVTQNRGVIPRANLEGRVMSPEGSTDGYKLVKKGDFAISLRSFQGGIEYSIYQGLISPAYTVLRSKLKIDYEFYRHFFKSYIFIEKYLSIAVIGIRDGKQISIPDFMTVKIPYPSLEQQKKIAFVLNTARQEIDLLKKQAEAYRKQKRGLMQKLLTGQWRVKIDEGGRVK